MRPSPLLLRLKALTKVLCSMKDIYWCPNQYCWYRYVSVDVIYVPCDNLCSPNIDGNSVCID